MALALLMPKARKANSPAITKRKPVGSRKNGSCSTPCASIVGWVVEKEIKQPSAAVSRIAPHVAAAFGNVNLVFAMRLMEQGFMKIV